MEKLKEFNGVEKRKLNDLVNNLKSPNMHKNAQSLGKEIDIWLSKGFITSEQKVRLIHWCEEKEDYSRKTCRIIAREINEIVFGKVITKYD